MVMLPPVLAHMKALGYAVFANPKYDYDLNIYGIRSKEAGTPNTFNDAIGVFYLWDGCWRNHLWSATVDPGSFWLENPMSVKGTAVLAPGQYRGAYELGKHRGQYWSLTQVGEVTVWRDPNRDTVPDRWGKTETGFFGINIHKAGKVSTQIDRWSAGCQVFQREKDFEEFMDICRKQVSLCGFKTFTYTLLDQWW